MTRELYDIWEDENGATKMQLVNYVGTFPDQGAAERFAHAVRTYRAAQVVVSKEPVKKGKS